MQNLEHNAAGSALIDCAIVLSEANSLAPLKGDFERMARRRYQKGTLVERNGMWVGMWRETILKDGKPTRQQVWRPLGSREDYPTRKLALRALEQAIAHVNDLSYRPRPVARFSEFAEKWQCKVLPNLKPSSHAPIRSQLRKHLLTQLGDVAMKDINPELLQSFVSNCGVSPKTVKNLIGTLRIMWNSARAWGYVGHDPFNGLVLPECDAPEQPSFEAQDIRRIIAAAEPPYNTVYWLVAQTGIRRGEVCALDVRHVDLDNLLIAVRRTRSGRYITDNKSRKPRLFPISPRLAERLRSLVEGRQADAPLFLSPKGMRLHPENLVKRKLKPLLNRLGLSGGLHAFRHGNASAQDHLNVPMKVRQERLGHENSRTTMGYTHMLTADSRRVPEQLDDLFCPPEQEGRVM